jgi:hypothetical protein
MLRVKRRLMKEATCLIHISFDGEHRQLAYVLASQTQFGNSFHVKIPSNTLLQASVYLEESP